MNQVIRKIFSTVVQEASDFQSVEPHISVSYSCGGSTPSMSMGGYNPLSHNQVMMFTSTALPPEKCPYAIVRKICGPKPHLCPQGIVMMALLAQGVVDDN